MKFTKNFILTMRNFARINPNMYFEKGFIQSTAMFTSQNSNFSTFFARAKTDVDIDSPFGIAELPKFITAISMFGNEAEATLSDTHLYIGEGDKKIRYFLTNPEYLKYEKNPNKFQVSESNINIEISKENLKSLTEMYSLFGLEYINFIGKDGLVIVSTDNGTSGGNGGSIIVGNSQEEFKAVIKTKNLLLYDGMSYNVSIVRKGYIHFSNNVFEYFLPCEKGLSQL